MFFRLTPHQRNRIREAGRRGITGYKLAQRFRRSSSTIHAILKKPSKSKATVVTEKNMSRLKTVIGSLYKKYQMTKEVTSAMIIEAFYKRYKVKLSQRSYERLKQQAGIKATSPQRKAVLDDEDMRAGKQFGQRYMAKTKDFWINNVSAYIDNKTFRVCPTSKAKKNELIRCPRFVYRWKGQESKR